MLSKEDEAKLKDILEVPSISVEFARQLAAKANLGSPTRPYYAVAFADKIRPFVERAIAEPGEYKILFAQFPQWKANTIRQRVFDSIKYLADHDVTPEKKYANWYASVTKSIIRNEHGKHIGILFSAPISGDIAFEKVSKEESEALKKSENLIVQNKKQTWQEIILNFIDGIDGRKSIKLPELSLTEQEVQYVKDSFNNAETKFTFVVSKTLIAAVRGEIKDEESSSDEA